MPPLLPRESMRATSVVSARIQRPSPPEYRVGVSDYCFGATSRFTCVAACYFANWELTTPACADAAPLNYQGVRTISWTGLQPASSNSCYCEHPGPLIPNLRAAQNKGLKISGLSASDLPSIPRERSTITGIPAGASIALTRTIYRSG